MIEVPFSKFHGAGNDFILINNLAEKYTLSHGQIRQLCQRHLGIGADGLILIENDAICDFRMLYFNSDGHEGSMCGNGGRAAAAFAYLENICSNNCSLMAYDGVHNATIIPKQDGLFDISITMLDVKGYISGEKHMILNTGSPHYVVECDNLSAIDVIKQGREIRYDKQISEDGVNVNFIQRIENELHVRTYERGVEAETLSCGTGVTAIAIAAEVWYGLTDAIIITQGGRFKVDFIKDGSSYRNIVLNGPVQFVFSGKAFI